MKFFKSKIFKAIILVTFLLTGIFPLPPAYSLNLKAPGQMIGLSPSFQPVLFRGIKLNPHDLFRFDFVLDGGERHLTPKELKTESTKMIKYFLASLTIPEEDLWVTH